MKTQRVHFLDLHWPLIAVVLAIAGLGIYNMHSSAAADAPTLYLTQLFWMGLGWGVVLLVLFVDYRITESIAYMAFAAVVVLLVGVLAGGKSAMGATRWITLGPVTFQPSEIAKIATVFCLARYFANRQEQGGYTLESLLKPFNLSRPLAAALVLAVLWSKPWMADPMGEIARHLYLKQQGNPPVLQELEWFRVLLAVWIAVGCVLSVWGIVRLERMRALLEPWPKGRRRLWIAVCVLGYAAAAFALAYFWHAPVMQDPFGFLLQWFYYSAEPGGAHAQLHPGFFFRFTAASVVGMYVLSGILALRYHQGRWVDAVIAPIDLVAVPAGLVLVQPDLGTAGIITLIGMTIVLVVGVRLRSLIIMAMMGVVLSCVAWFGVLKDYQKRRILTFLDPEHDIKGAGWNAVQSMIAVGSGRWLGKGHRGGTQTQLSFLPEQHTDFAFSVWAEEQGFIGATLLVFLYLCLGSFTLAIAADARDKYGTLLATGVAALIFWQAIINIGMVIGALPVVGITLPLFSYGGSSVLTIMMAIGLALSVHLRRKVY
jgi:cell division protein FtsW (lipid II flippase)